MIYTLTILFFFQHQVPVLGAKYFGDLKECQIAEGVILTSANADDTVTGWKIVDDCQPIGGKATKS